MRQIFKQSAQLAVRTGVVGLVLQALDGTKIEAAASGHSGWSQEYMEKLLAALDATLDQTELALLQENQEPSGRALYAQRGQIIERRFGQIKQHDGFRRWTVWGLEAVRTQWSVLCATLNLRILHKRWRSVSPAGPKAAAARTGRAEKPRIFLAPVLFQVQQMQDAARRAIERGCRCVPNWAA